MSNEIVVPFALDVNGMVLATQDPAVQAMQHVRSVIATRPGERVMLPNYGVPEYVFKPDPVTIAIQIQKDITDQLNTWEPTIQVNSIIPSDTDSAGSAQVTVDFTTDPTQTANIQTATIMIGGTVIQDTPAATS